MAAAQRCHCVSQKTAARLKRGVSLRFWRTCHNFGRYAATFWSRNIAQHRWRRTSLTIRQSHDNKYEKFPRFAIRIVMVLHSRTVGRGPWIDKCLSWSVVDLKISGHFVSFVVALFEVFVSCLGSFFWVFCAIVAGDVRGAASYH